MMSLPQDLEQALAHVMAQEGLSRDEAVIALLRSGIEARNQAGSSGDALRDESAAPTRPDPELVQYPGYFKGEGSL